MELTPTFTIAMVLGGVVVSDHRIEDSSIVGIKVFATIESACEYIRLAGIEYERANDTQQEVERIIRER